MQFGSPEDLIARLSFSLTQDEEKRPLAFLTGAGLSSGVVPGVSETIQILRKQLPPNEQLELDEFLRPFPEQGEKYRQAFQFVGLRRPPAWVERAIRLATLRAFSQEGTNQEQLVRELPADLEMMNASWRVPKGQAALGRIIAGLPAGLRGPVLTTNFDPLTEIAIRRAGVAATTYVHADDSSFLSNLRVQTGPAVVHLHGFWRDAQALNTDDQLALERPTLSAALRVILERYTLVVLGYGGWADIISRTILGIVQEQRANDVDILWCFYEDASSVTRRLNSSDANLNIDLIPGNASFYTSVDANQMLPDLERKLAPILDFPDSPRALAASGAPLLAWKSVTPAELDNYALRASRATAMSFLDGRAPAWHDALNPDIPLRELTLELQSLLGRNVAKRESSMTVLVGPSAEGKSTVLLQTAVRMSRDDVNLNVLSLETASFGSVRSLLSLPEDRPTLLVIDDAHRQVSSIQDAANLLHESGRKDVHFLMAVRDTDWVASGGAQVAWQRLLPYTQRTLLGLSHADAESLVSTWEEIGAEALGQLASTSSHDARVEILEEFSQGDGSDGPGSLLGALLATRYDRDGLREHLRQLVLRMRLRVVAPSADFTLEDALYSIAVPHAYGVTGLTEAVLAESLGLNRVELQAYVLIPLGEEAAISYMGGHVIMRHELIASVILDLGLEDSIRLYEATERVVRAAATRLARRGYNSDILPLAYLSGRIYDIPALAVAAADAAIVGAPRRLSFHTSKSAILRKNKRAPEAAQVNLDAIALIKDAENADQVRAFLSEWGVVEGVLGRPARNAVLDGLALQDGRTLGRAREASSFAISGLLVAFRRLYEGSPDERFLRAGAAVCEIARKGGLGVIKEFLRSMERQVLRADPSLLDSGDWLETTSWLSEGLALALATIESDLPPGLPQPNWQFEGLKMEVNTFLG